MGLGNCAGAGLCLFTSHRQSHVIAVPKPNPTGLNASLPVRILSIFGAPLAHTLSPELVDGLLAIRHAQQR